MTPETRNMIMRFNGGRLLGALLLLHLILGLIGPYMVLVPMAAPPGGFLENAAAMDTSARASVMALMAGVVALMLITLVPWATWRAAAPRLALTLLVLAAANVALQLLENVQWLTMASVSAAHHRSGQDASAVTALVAAVGAQFKWVHYTHILTLVSWILILFIIFRQAHLLPRGMAEVGIAASVLHMLGIPLPVFVGIHVPGTALWGIPLALTYLGAGLWLLVRGMRTLPGAGSTLATGVG